MLPVVALALAASGGCGTMPPLRGTISQEARTAFRYVAVRTLIDAGFSDDPSLRMHAIEALSEVAPEEGRQCIELNVENEYAGASFAALMAVGRIARTESIDRVRLRLEHSDPNVRIAALYALHRLDDGDRIAELADYLLNHRDARVRANAALAIGRLEEPSAVGPLRKAIKQEKKLLPRMQITEALAILGNQRATETLQYQGNSEYPDQATMALMFLGNARCVDAEELFRDRLFRASFPEVRVAAARGLGRLGLEQGLDIALRHLWFNSPKKGWPDDPPERQVVRVRSLAAGALESIGSPDALESLKAAFELQGLPEEARVAIARAAIHIIDRQDGMGGPEYTAAGREPDEE